VSATTTDRVEILVVLADEMEQLIGCSKFTTAANKALHSILRCDIMGTSLNLYHPRYAYWAEGKVHLVGAEGRDSFKTTYTDWHPPTHAQLLEHLSNRLKPLEKYKLIALAPQPSKPPRGRHRDRGPALRPSLAMFR